MRGELTHDQGAYTPQGLNLPYNASTGVPGPYILPAYDLRVLVVETNKVATMPVRGAGYPEAAFAMERVLDRIARQLGLDRTEVRRRNLVPADRIPYVTPLKTRAGSPVALDSGDFRAASTWRAMRSITPDLPDGRRRAREQGRHLGIGVGNGVKGTGRGPFESGIVRIGRSGRISVYTGAMPMGQGIKTALAQICAEKFAVAADSVTVVAGDTAVIPHGQGGFASRQTVTAGSAVHLAALAVREKCSVLPHISWRQCRGSRVAGWPRRGRRRSRQRPHAPRSCRSGLRRAWLCHAGEFEPGLESLQNFLPSALTYGMGCHAVEVEVDVETGGVHILRYVVVNDSGRLINPMIVEGQLVGGTVHGIGNSLFEWMGYDDNAQPLTTTFADYLLPTATEVPKIEVHFLECPSPLNPLGVKGVGKSGCVPAAGAIVAAVKDDISFRRDDHGISCNASQVVCVNRRGALVISLL